MGETSPPVLVICQVSEKAASAPPRRPSQRTPRNCHLVYTTSPVGKIRVR